MIRQSKKRPQASLSLGIIPGEMDVIVNPPGMIQIHSTIYLQEQLRELRSDHVKLEIVKPSKAVLPDGWHYLDADYALIGKHRRLYGTLNAKYLAKSGWKCGDTVTAYVGIPPKHSKHYTLWLPEKER